MQQRFSFDADDFIRQLREGADRDYTTAMASVTCALTRASIEAQYALLPAQENFACVYIGLREAGRSGRLVIVAENHSVVGGLGEAVAGVLLRAGVTPPFRQIALPDAFLDAGALPTLHDKYGISTVAMTQSIKGWIN